LGETTPESRKCPIDGIPELLVPWLPKLNPGLEFANTFGVEFFQIENDE
jgi:hypothetical protein